MILQEHNEPASVRDTGSELPFLFHMLQLKGAVNKVLKCFMSKSGFPLSTEQLPVLMCIHSMGVVCQQEIATLICRDKSAVHRTITRFEDSGLIHICCDKRDKRKNLVSLTEAGKAIVHKVTEFDKNIQENYFEHNHYHCKEASCISRMLVEIAEDKHAPGHSIRYEG